MPLHDPVIYHIYPRSFADANGDGNGDLAGITAKLDYLADLGVDGVWLNPIYASPLVDMGYDVSDYRAIDPMYGTLDEFDRLIAEAHARNIAVLMDMVPCHTSIEHRWFAEHPEYYVWSPLEGPPNNWLSMFGGDAWSRDPRSGRWYMHLFYPEQPALNFHNPDVEAAIDGEMQFWFDRGVDGFRLDAVQFLYTDPELQDWQPIGDKISTEVDPRISVWDCTPDDMLDLAGQWLQRLRTRHPDKYFVTEANVAIDRIEPFTTNANASFCFEFLKYAQPELAVIEPLLQAATQDPGIAWCIGNHDVGRLISRWGYKYARAAATLVCTLPGSAFIYMGDEIGMTNGPGTTPPIDRYGRDAVRHPMQWHPDGGFTTGTPWLPMHNPAEVNVAAQRDESSSLLNWYRHLLQLRREFVSHPLVWGDCDNNVLRYSRGRFEVAIDFTSGDVSVN